jgi:hypothetical protein
MTTISREEIHARLDAAFDAQETARGANDPDRAAEAKDVAFALGMAFIKALLGDLIAERMGAARLSRAYLQPSSPWGQTAIDAAQRPVAPAALNMDRNEAAQQRWMTTRFLQDFEDLLPPGLARNFAGAMLGLNVGVETQLMRPLRVKGMPHKPTTHLQYARALLAYYRAGYCGISLDQTLRDDADLFGHIGYDTLKSIVQRLGIGELTAMARADGASDRASGRPVAAKYLVCADFLAFMKETTGKQQNVSVGAKIVKLAPASRVEMRHGHNQESKPGGDEGGGDEEIKGRARGG